MKRIHAQAMVRLPLEAQKRHEEEAQRLRSELDASRRHEEQLTIELRAQVLTCVSVIVCVCMSVCVCVWACVCV